MAQGVPFTNGQDAVKDQGDNKDIKEEERYIANKVEKYMVQVMENAEVNVIKEYRKGYKQYAQ